VHNIGRTRGAGLPEGSEIRAHDEEFTHAYSGLLHPGRVLQREPEVCSQSPGGEYGLKEQGSLLSSLRGRRDDGSGRAS